MSGPGTEEPRHHIQATASSERLVCSTYAKVGTTPLEILLDSGSSISSISEHFVHKLGLPISSAPPITVLFGDSHRPYHSNRRALCTFILANQTFSHAVYVLPRQLFPPTLGCDWFLRTRAQLNFEKRKLILPRVQHIQIFVNNGSCSPVVNTQVATPDARQRQQDLQSLLGRFPHLVNPVQESSAINFPVAHKINTGNSQPIRMAS